VRREDPVFRVVVRLVESALAALLRRFPSFVLADEPLEWREAAARGLRRLPLIA
jgi:hypothetical protein